MITPLPLRVFRWHTLEPNSMRLMISLGLLIGAMTFGCDASIDSPKVDKGGMQQSVQLKIRDGNTAGMPNKNIRSSRLNLDYLRARKWTISGAWINDETTTLNMRFGSHFPTKSEDGTVYLELRGKGVGVSTSTFDVVVDGKRNRILFYPFTTVGYDNQKEHIATATVDARGILQVTGKFDLPRFTLDIDAGLLGEPSHED
jgi:hypothetical protein